MESHLKSKHSLVLPTMNHSATAAMIAFRTKADITERPSPSLTWIS